MNLCENFLVTSFQCTTSASFDYTRHSFLFLLLSDEAEEDVVYSDIRLKQLARETRETPPISNQDES